MPIKRKSSIEKKYYERRGQGKLFGHDNLHFKTVNLPKTQKFKDLCPKFNLKKINKNKLIKIPFITIN